MSHVSESLRKATISASFPISGGPNRLLSPMQLCTGWGAKLECRVAIDSVLGSLTPTAAVSRVTMPQTVRNRLVESDRVVRAG